MTVDTATGEIVAHLSAADARNLTDRIRGGLSVAYDGLVEAWSGRADLALGYESWDDYCAAEFAEGRMVRLDREQRREIVGTMREAGMSTRQIGSALGVDQKTVVNDARRTEESSSVAEAVDRYPDLDAYRDQPDQVLATAAALDDCTESERPVRLDALAKHAAAKREGRLPRPAVHDPRPAQIFDHVNAAARLLDGHEHVVIDAADPVIRDTWREQYERTGRALLDLAERLGAPTTLRRVR